MTAVPIEPADLGEYLELPPDGVPVELILPNDHQPSDVISPRYRIIDVGGAVWAMRRLASHQTRIAANARAAREESDRIRTWVKEANEPHVGSVAFFEGLLREWHAGQIEEDLGVNVLHEDPDAEQWRRYKGKTAKLPNGKVPARIGSGKFMAEEGGVELAIAFLKMIGRPDLLVYPAPTISPDLLDGQLDTNDEDTGRPSVMFDGLSWWVCATTDYVDDAAVVGAMSSLLADDGFTDPATTVIDAFAEHLPLAQQVREMRPMLKLAQDLGESARCEAWVRIPGVLKVGVGHVTITPKPNMAAVEPRPLIEAVEPKDWERYTDDMLDKVGRQIYRDPDDEGPLDLDRSADD